MAGKIQAREIIRYAKRHRISIVHCGISDTRACARAVVSHMVLGSSDNMYSPILWKKLGLTYDNLTALEHGFEGHSYNSRMVKDRYYKVGQRVAKLAGLEN